MSTKNSQSIETKEYKYILGSELPEDLLNKDKNNYRRNEGFVMSVGSLNLKTGNHKYWNVCEDGETTIEVYKVKKIKTVSMFRVKETVTYRFVLNSGNKSVFNIGDKVEFYNCGKFSFVGELIDYVDARGFSRLTEKYGKSGSAYVYK